AGSVAVTWRNASSTAGCVAGYRRVNRKVVPIAPSAWSQAFVSTAMPSALDALSEILVSEHPGGEARRRDLVLRLDRGPIHIAPGLVAPRWERSGSSPALGLGDHLRRSLAPQAEVRRPQIDPAPRRRRERVARWGDRRDHHHAATV